MSAFKTNKLKKIFSKLILLGLMVFTLLVSSNFAFATSKDCYTCSPDYVPGNPVEGNKTLGQLSQISLLILSDKDSSFMSNLSAYCMDFPGDERGAKTLRKRMIQPMEKTAPQAKIEAFFLEAGCEPENFGSSRVTIAQIAAEYPLSRLEHLEVLKKYFVEKNKLAMFTKILNAKNTQGYTTLDYLNYLVENKKFTQVQIDASVAFRNYLCANGAVYSIYSNKSCESTVATK